MTIIKVRYYDERFEDECDGFIVDDKMHIAEQCGWEQYCSVCVNDSGQTLVGWPCPIVILYEMENNVK